MCREALDVRLLELPERLPDLLPVVQPEVLDEVGLAHVAAQRDEQVHESLDARKKRTSVPSDFTLFLSQKNVFTVKEMTDTR